MLTCCARRLLIIHLLQVFTIKILNQRFINISSGKCIEGWRYFSHTNKCYKKFNKRNYSSAVPSYCYTSSMKFKRDFDAAPDLKTLKFLQRMKSDEDGLWFGESTEDVKFPWSQTDLKSAGFEGWDGDKESSVDVGNEIYIEAEPMGEDENDEDDTKSIFCQSGDKKLFFQSTLN